MWNPCPQGSSVLKRRTATVAEHLASELYRLGFRHFFGVSGGAIAYVWAALERGPIGVLHFRHEAGAGFAATEASLVDGRPTGVFVTAGPGLTNVLTGACAARCEGGKVLVLSPTTDTSMRGRGAFQESGPHTLPNGLYTDGSPFHYACTLESPEQLPTVLSQLAQGFRRPEGFIAHLAIPPAVQHARVALPQIGCLQSHRASLFDPAEIDACATNLAKNPFAIWVGYGARHAAHNIRELAEKTGAMVMCTPRGKGIFPASHRLFAGVTGFGSSPKTLTNLAASGAKRLLVLGSRLGEFSSTWDPKQVPVDELIHVDIDPSVPGRAYPSVKTHAVIGDIGTFVDAIVDRLPVKGTLLHLARTPRPALTPSKGTSPIRPQALFAAIQAVVVEGSDAVVMTEAGNCFAWGSQHLSFETPGRYRVSTSFGSMGHAVAGMIGAAIARTGKAVAIVGDGAMLMNGCEVSTARHANAPVVWIVLNDGYYNMCRQGIEMLQVGPVDTAMPDTDFVGFANALGVPAQRVADEGQLIQTLCWAMAQEGPCVVDVAIDPTPQPNIHSRIAGLARGQK